jgi:hypothetical protein
MFNSRRPIKSMRAPRQFYAKKLYNFRENPGGIPLGLVFKAPPYFLENEDGICETYSINSVNLKHFQVPKYIFHMFYWLWNTRDMIVFLKIKNIDLPSKRTLAINANSR